jgi:hypothetical protein
MSLAFTALGILSRALVALVCRIDLRLARKPLGPVDGSGAPLTAGDLIIFCATARTYYLPDDPEIAGIEAAIEDDLANGVL